MEQAIGLAIAFAVVFGIFVIIPLVVFLIVRKILSDRHRERMAMIENGLTHKYRRPEPAAPEQNAAPASDTRAAQQDSAAPGQENPVPRTDYYRKDKAEESTVKWMYIFGGAAVGLLVASIVTNLLFTYTLIETKGLGLSIVVLSVCVALYLYYVRKNRRGGPDPRQGNNISDNTYNED